MSHESEHDYEPIRGLPGRLPPGEHILWQGEPDWRAFARHAMQARTIAIYFGILMAWRLITTLSDGGGVGMALVDVLTLVPVALAGVGLLVLFAWLVGRTTVYTITNKRVVIRAGVALPKAVNIPFTIIETAQLKERGQGRGDIALALKGPDRIAFLHLWPHVRPWRLAKAEPALRCIPQAEQVGQILAGALEATAETAPKVRRRSRRPATATGPARPAHAGLANHGVKEAV